MLVPGRVAARVAVLFGRFFPDLLDILGFAVQDGLLGNSKIYIVLLIESLHIFLPFTLGLIVMFHSFIPTSHRSSQSIFDGLLVGTISKTFLRTVRHKLFLRHS